MNNVKLTSGGGISFYGLLTVLFIALKLLDKIDWTWTWVLAPMWVPLTLFFMWAVIVGIVAGMSGK